jgi:hypothetical protein
MVPTLSLGISDFTRGYRKLRKIAQQNGRGASAAPAVNGTISVAERADASAAIARWDPEGRSQTSWGSAYAPGLHVSQPAS